MKSAVTICLVPEARQGPFVFHDGLESGCRSAAELGFDGVEVFPSSAASINTQQLRSLLHVHQLSLAAVGTGSGWLLRQWSLTSEDPSVRDRAREFIQAIIDVAGQFGVSAIVGSMQGKTNPGQPRAEALSRLADGLGRLSEYSMRHYGVPVLFEPLNRYESNIFNRLQETVDWLSSVQLDGVRLLADMFHMNIEEANLANAIEQAGKWIGHVHFADSNRHAVGLGHSDASAVVAALARIGYSGYLSAEIFPRPDSLAAARQTIESFRSLIDSRTTT